MYILSPTLLSQSPMGKWAEHDIVFRSIEYVAPLTEVSYCPILRKGIDGLVSWNRHKMVKAVEVIQCQLALSECCNEVDVIHKLWFRSGILKSNLRQRRVQGTLLLVPLLFRWEDRTGLLPVPAVRNFPTAARSGKQISLASTLFKTSSCTSWGVFHVSFCQYSEVLLPWWC